MVLLLTVTPAISEALLNYFSTTTSNDTNDTSDTDDPTPAYPPKLSRASYQDYKESIPHSDLLLLARHAHLPLARLVVGAQVYFPPKKTPPPKTKEYLQLMESLRIKQQEQEYQTLIGNADYISQKDNLTPGMAVKELREQLTTIVNVAVTVGSVATGVWWWSGTSTNFSLASRTLLVVFASILVLVAEASVYLGYKRRIEEAKTAERAKVEVKEVLSTTTIAPATPVTSIKKINGSTGNSKRSDAVRRKKP